MPHFVQDLAHSGTFRPEQNGIGIYAWITIIHQNYINIAKFKIYIHTTRKDSVWIFLLEVIMSFPVKSESGAMWTQLSDNFYIQN